VAKARGSRKKYFQPSLLATSKDVIRFARAYRITKPDRALKPQGKKKARIEKISNERTNKGGTNCLGLI
jgi:hypothetical protein